MILAAIMSGTALAATTGIAAGALLLVTAAGFHDLARFDRTQTEGRNTTFAVLGDGEARDLSTTLQRPTERAFSYLEGRFVPATSSPTDSETEGTKPFRRRRTDDRTEVVEQQRRRAFPQRVFE